jgi:hypothetical protein
LKVEPELTEPIKVRFTITNPEIQVGDESNQLVEISETSLTENIDKTKILFVNKESVINMYPINKNLLVLLKQKPANLDSEGRLSNSDKPSLELLSSKSCSTVFTFLMIGSLLFNFLSGSNLFGIKVGVAIVKIFQLIEILAKLVFVPVFFTGILKDVLYVIYKMGDPFDLDPQTLIDYPVDFNISSNRGKITLFEEYSNILQSFPLMSLILLIVILGEAAATILEIFIPTNKFLKKSSRVLTSLVYSLIEMNLVDYVFYATYNIHQAPRNTEHDTPSLFSGKNISLACSMVILSRIAFM